ncbi:Predicted acetyltransferase [Tatumella ptyseos]|uniref:Predicted acetyltransferase n=1 Tax=Tatumella ptyseos TaxID=82987 RepID=A0A2X5P5T0_9GAMM|nr:Predicted acetyltransferase [Tatumella ptyseos]
MLLSPLAIDAACRSLALDEQLVREALDTLNEFGYGAVVARENLPCLTQVGFRPGEKLHYQLPADNRQQTLLIYPLANDPVGMKPASYSFPRRFTGDR